MKLLHYQLRTTRNCSSRIHFEDVFPKSQRLAYLLFCWWNSRWGRVLDEELRFFLPFIRTRCLRCRRFSITWTCSTAYRPRATKVAQGRTLCLFPVPKASRSTVDSPYSPIFNSLVRSRRAPGHLIKLMFSRSMDVVNKCFPTINRRSCVVRATQIFTL